jgi:FKBP-type peptidyl-prolyl cis-trans isomerase (trigger factor)
VAELVDALDLGSSSRKGVWVRVPPLAPNKKKKADVMVQEKAYLRIETNNSHPAVCRVAVVIDKEIVNKLYAQATLSQQKTIKTSGFQQGAAPLEYIKHNFNLSLTDHLKEFLFHFFVISYLHQQIREHKIFAAGEPRLTDIDVAPNKDAFFYFDLTTLESIPFQNWKFFPFKAPKRKRYKDLDRQVSLFVEEEKENLVRCIDCKVEIGDWVCLDISVLDDAGNNIFGDYKENLWLKVGNEAGDEEFQQLFLGKRPGDIFKSSASCLQEYFSNQIDTNYTFLIEIKDVLNDAYFCFDQFKRIFRVKTNKDMMQRLVEVFSFRNDLSQRQLMIEESLKLLLTRHPFDVPKYLVLRQEKQVLDAVKDNPDYHVYRVQHDFKEYVHKLAEKQIKERVIIDQLAHREGINVEHEDIKNYLNLTKRSRMKDFIYFEHPDTKIDGREMPISSELLKQTCLREKTLNYIIYHLTRK